MAYKITQLQTNCNKGILSPLLDARKDLNSYYNGVAEAENFLSLPQGGLKKRKGTKFLAEISFFARPEEFVFSTEDRYLLVFDVQKMFIFKNKTLQTNINGSGNDYLELPFMTGIINLEMDYIQSMDTIILTHTDMFPTRIKRITDTTWEWDAVPLTDIPKYDFDDSSSPSPITEVQELKFNDKSNDGDRFKISLNGVLTDYEITYLEPSSFNDDNQKATAKAIQEGLLDHPLTASSGIRVVPVDKYIYYVYFEDKNADEWELMNITHTYTVSATGGVKCQTKRIVKGQARKENTWSQLRGYPSKCTFHEGRLWFGGSRSRPATIWGSRVNDFFSFKQGRQFDDDAIEAPLNTDQANPIVALFSNRTLQVFTSGQEFYCPATPITPEKVSFPPQTNVGAKAVKPVTIDGVTLFVQETGKAIIQFLFVDENKANQSGSISFTAEHIFSGVQKMSVKKGEVGEDANYVFINNDNGRVALFNTLQQEEVAGFTEWVTANADRGDGVFQTAIVDHEAYHVTIRKPPSGGNKYYIEVETDDCFLDSSVTQTGSSNLITGLDHLEGETVVAVGDNNYLGEFTVVSGKITLPKAYQTRSAGLWYAPYAKGMPLNFDLGTGMNAYKKKKISRFSVNLFESNGVIINGERIPDKKIGINQFDPPVPFTGTVRRHSLGWTLEAQWEITQETPYDLQIRGVGMEVIS